MTLEGQKQKPLDKFKREMKKRWMLYLMLLIPMIFLIIFSYIPMGGLTIAFQDYSVRKGIINSEWVGLKHFIQFFENQTLFWSLLKNTISISLYSLLASFPVPIILALCLNEIKNKKVKKTVQMVTYAPYFISTVILVSMINQILNPNVGLVNNIIGIFGGEKVDFLGRSDFFRHVYVWSGVWQGAGYSAILYLASLAGIDQEMVEATIVDGANRFQRIWYIDLPTIAPTIVVMLILAIGGVMNVGFEKIYLMQNPINLGVSEVIGTMVYKRGLQMNQYSYATAVGLFNSVVNVILLAGANFLSKRFGENSLW